MKKIYSFALFCAIGLSANAQVAEEAAIPMPPEGTEKKIEEKKATVIATNEEGLTEEEVKAKRTELRENEDKRKQIISNTNLTKEEREKALKELEEQQSVKPQKRGANAPVLKELESPTIKN